jgi:hypothetical protein
MRETEILRGLHKAKDKMASGMPMSGAPGGKGLRAAMSHYARGGMIPGDARRLGDNKPVLTTPGEAILPTQTVAALGGPSSIQKMIRSTTGVAPRSTLRGGAHYARGFDGSQPQNPALPPINPAAQAPVAPAAPAQEANPRLLNGAGNVQPGNYTNGPGGVATGGVTGVTAGVNTLARANAAQAARFVGPQPQPAAPGSLGSAAKAGYGAFRDAARATASPSTAPGVEAPETAGRAGLFARYKAAGSAAYDAAKGAYSVPGAADAAAAPGFVARAASNLPGAGAIAKTAGVAGAGLTGLAKYGGKILKPIGIANDLSRVYNTAVDPNTSVSDVAVQAGRQFGKFAATAAGATAGAEGGAALGALGGPLAPVTVPAGALIGGIGGGLAGYFGADKVLPGHDAPGFIENYLNNKNAGAAAAAQPTAAAATPPVPPAPPEPDTPEQAAQKQALADQQRVGQQSAAFEQQNPAVQNTLQNALRNTPTSAPTVGLGSRDLNSADIARGNAGLRAFATNPTLRAEFNARNDASGNPIHAGVENGHASFSGNGNGQLSQYSSPLERAAGHLFSPEEGRAAVQDAITKNGGGNDLRSTLEAQLANAPQTAIKQEALAQLSRLNESQQADATTRRGQDIDLQKAKNVLGYNAAIHNQENTQKLSTEFSNRALAQYNTTGPDGKATVDVPRSRAFANYLQDSIANLKDAKGNPVNFYGLPADDREASYQSAVRRFELLDKANTLQAARGAPGAILGGGGVQTNQDNPPVANIRSPSFSDTRRPGGPGLLDLAASAVGYHPGFTRLQNGALVRTYDFTHDPANGVLNANANSTVANLPTFDDNQQYSQSLAGVAKRSEAAARSAAAKKNQ